MPHTRHITLRRFPVDRDLHRKLRRRLHGTARCLRPPGLVGVAVDQVGAAGTPGEGRRGGGGGAHSPRQLGVCRLVCGPRLRSAQSDPPSP